MVTPITGLNASRARWRFTSASTPCTSCCSPTRDSLVPERMRHSSWLAGLALATVLAHTAFAQEQTVPRRIVLLHATELLQPGTVEQDGMTRQALTDALDQPLEFYSFSFDEV